MLLGVEEVEDTVQEANTVDALGQTILRARCHQRILSYSPVLASLGVDRKYGTNATVCHEENSVVEPREAYQEWIILEHRGLRNARQPVRVVASEVYLVDMGCTYRRRRRLEVLLVVDHVEDIWSAF